MIRVTVKKKNHSYASFHSKGHAGYADSGKDIICAAVSALVITAVNSIETFTEDEIELKEGDGEVFFRFTDPVSERGTLLMDALVLGLTQIEESCDGKYLEVITKEV